jgi:hypothetical protein
MNKYKIQSLTHDDMFTEISCSLELAKTIAVWNYQKGYKLIDLSTGEAIDQREHYCAQCHKCSTCNHIRSDHHSDDDAGPKPCRTKKCKCKEFKQ